MEGPHRGPGMSIFQGSEQLHVDTNNQREIEEEAAADQQRRDVELQKLLTNAFDDLYDDNESTISSIAASDQNSQEGDEKHGTVADRYHAALFGSEENESRYILDGDTDAAFDNGDTVLPKHSAAAMEMYMNNRNLADTMSHQLQDMGGGDATSVSALHYQHCFRTSPGGTAAGAAGNLSLQGANEQYRQTSYNSVEQLQVLYEVRVREAQRLAAQVQQLQGTAAQEREQLQRRLVLAQAEAEQAQKLHTQAQELLVQSKDKISTLEKKVVTLEATVENLEKKKSDLSSQLEASQLSVDSLHQKILLLERTSIGNADKQVDAFMRNVQAMHNQQLKKLEDELDAALTKLSAKEQEMEQQKQEGERRVQQLEARMAERGDTLNQMARALEESQRHCQQLVASGTGQEVGRLQLQLRQMAEERDKLQAQLQGARKEVEAIHANLKQYEAIVKYDLLQESNGAETDSMVHMGLCGQRTPESTQQLLDTNNKLRHELQRALISQKEKREELSNLTSQHETLKEKLSVMQMQEQQSKAQIKNLEAECAALRRASEREEQGKQEESEEAQRRLEEARAAGAGLEAQAREAEAERRAMELALLKQQQQAEALNKELLALREQLAQREEQGPGDEYLQFHEQALARALDDRDEKHRMVLNTLSAELEQSQKECDGVKELYISVCKAKEELFTGLHKEQARCKELEEQLCKMKAELQAASDLNHSRSIKQEAAIVKLKAQTEKLQQERKALADIQDLSSQLESERAKAKELEAQNKLFLEKLKQGKENLEAAEKAVAETAVLRAELDTQTTKLKDLEQHYEAALKQLQNEKEQAVQELEQKAKALYTEKITEEIEKAKREALEELKKNCSEEKETQKDAKIKQLEGDYVALQQQYEEVLEQRQSDTVHFAQRLQEQDQALKQALQHKAQLCQALAQKEEQLGKGRPVSRTSDKSGDSVECDKIYRELSAAYTEKLNTLKVNYEQQMQEKCSHIQEETIRYCIKQMRESEVKYLTIIKKNKESQEEQISVLRAALVKSKKEIESYEEKLREIHSTPSENSKKNSDNEFKAQVKELEERLKNVELKAAQKERELERTKLKFTANKNRMKKYMEDQKIHMEKEWQRLNTHYKKLLSELMVKLSSVNVKEDMNQVQKAMEETLRRDLT